MKTFRYKAINKANQELTGSITGENLELVRNKLNTMGLSIIDISEVASIEKTEDIPTFEFEGSDPAGKKVKGTIQANNEEEAFKRLVEEYNFNLTTLFDIKTPKSKRKKSSINKLQEKYEKELELKQKKEEEIYNEREKQHFIRKINYTLEKVDNILKEYGDKIKPEDKKIISDYIQELIRYKESTNLRHLEKIGEKLLKHLQKDDIFITKDTKEKTNLQVKSQQLISSLKKKSKKPAKKISESKIVEKTVPTFQKISKLISKKLNPPENKKVTELKEKLKENKNQLIEYVKLYFQNRSKQYKEEIGTNIKRLYKNRKQYKEEIRELKSTKDKKSISKYKSHRFINILTDVKAFLGWLLTFYLIFYFIAIFITTKDLGIANIPTNFYIYNSNFFIFAIAIVFLTYLAISTKIHFFKKNQISDFIIFPVWFIVLLLTIFNFS